MLITLLSYGLYYLYRILDIAILVYCVASWFVRPGTKAYYYYGKLAALLEPLFMPVRKLLYKLRLNLPVDLSPWITLLLLGVVYRLIISLLLGLKGIR